MVNDRIREQWISARKTFVPLWRYDPPRDTEREAVAQCDDSIAMAAGT